jgi:hypothetical protein
MPKKRYFSAEDDGLLVRHVAIYGLQAVEEHLGYSTDIAKRRLSELRVSIPDRTLKVSAPSGLPVSEMLMSTRYYITGLFDGAGDIVVQNKGKDRKPTLSLVVGPLPARTVEYMCDATGIGNVSWRGSKSYFAIYALPDIRAFCEAISGCSDKGRLIEAAITYFEAETQEARAEALKDLEVEREAVWR